MAAREAASPMAPASTNSLLFVLAKGRTTCGEIGLTWCPNDASLRVMCCASAHASITAIAGMERRAKFNRLLEVQFFAKQAFSFHALSVQAQRAFF
jgi:hypothetical protein